MSQIDPEQIKELVLNPVFWLLGGFVVKDLWKWFKRDRKSQEQALAALRDSLAVALKDNTSEMAKLTIAVLKLEMRLENVDKLVSGVPKMAQDINVLFDRQRSINKNGPGF